MFAEVLSLTYHDAIRARLENESGDTHRVIPKHSFTQSIQRLPTTKCLLM